MDTHACPIRGCTAFGLRRDYLMCWRHWRRVPRALQHAVYAAWNGGQPTADYPSVRQAAIDAIETVSQRPVFGQESPPEQRNCMNGGGRGLRS